MDATELFGLTMSPLELVIRGTVMYLGLFLIFRVVIKRRVGAVGMADILVLVIIADAAQNGISGSYKSITEGLILVGVIVSWSKLFDVLAFRAEWLRKLVEPDPLPLVEHGKVLYRNLRQEHIPMQELEGKLREHGFDDVADVERAVMESDGQISVIDRDRSHRRSQRAPRSSAAAGSPGTAG